MTPAYGSVMLRVAPRPARVLGGNEREAINSGVPSGGNEMDRPMGEALEETVVIPSKRAAAGKAEREVLCSARKAGFSDESLFAIRLAVDEAIANAIQHGNRGDPSKHVTIRYRVDRDRFEITVADEGHGFHPDQLPDPTTPENIERPHGRGVMLMRAYMTEVSFNERGNEVTMVKRRDCHLPRRRA